MKKNLLLFTRYPLAGHTKTRLIPALGREGAAQLQRQLTEKTLRTAEYLAARCPLSLAITHAGGTTAQMMTWLGPNHLYREQGSGDLGAKMARAFTASFKNGHQQVVIIGSDCPDLSTEILATAFAKLAHHDLVLGPARDGGYYLIGLRRPCPELFSRRSWGTALLLAETLAVAKKLALNPYLLEELTDVDRPEDLKYISNYSDPE